MNVLFVRHMNPNLPTITEYIVQRFQSLGYQLQVLEYCDHTLPGRFVQRFRFS